MQAVGMPTVYADSRAEPNTTPFTQRNGAVTRQLVDCS